MALVTGLNNYNSYYSNAGTFKNSLYAINISIIEHFENLLFEGETTRMVYSSNEFALRARAKTQPNNNLNFPFMNFKLGQGGYSDRNVPKRWYNRAAEVEGIYSDILQQKVKCLPVIFTYESTLFLHMDIDAQYAMYKLSFENSMETYISPNPSLTVGDHTLDLIGILGFPNLEWNPQYQESEWLTMNKIQTIALNFTIESFLIDVNADVTITETRVLNFMTNHDLIVGDTYDSNYNIILDDYFSETI